MHTVRLALVALLFALLVAPAAGQSVLMSPEEFLGYPLGERFTPHHRVMDYVRHMADQSPRVELRPYGETYEHREMVMLAVSAPQNIARLGAIRQAHLDVVEGRRSYGADDPAIVFLAFNIHGNEASSTEAAMRTLHTLASGSDARADAWLEDVVVLIDPVMNPDGRERYVNWYRQTVGASPEPHRLARERNEPWPGARTNHYYFDLNRDWAWLTQQESRFRIPMYNEWMPHIHADFHEQSHDSPYYFAPAAEPFHAAITDWQREFQNTIGRNHIRYFDPNNWLYFTRQRFDLLYPGYGDTWPTFNGAIGMTYEQAGGGRAGLAIETSEGDTLTLADRLEHHFTTAMSTIETAARHRIQLLREFEQYFADARSNTRGPGAYVVSRRSNPQATDALADLLLMQGIEVGTPSASTSISASAYADGARQNLRIEPGDLIVSTRQPKGVLVDVLFEQDPALVDSITYDITAWSLPYAFGVETFTTDEVPSVRSFMAESPVVTGTERPYAYLAPWSGPRSVRFLADVLQQDVRLRFNTQPFEIDGEPWRAGTLILTRRGNEALGDDFDRIVREAAQREGLAVHGAGTGFVASGSDFGARDVLHLAPPRVAAVSGSGISAGALGEVWHFFDRQIEYPLLLIDQNVFDPADLDEVDVLVLVDGSYAQMLNDERLAALRRWVEAGGRLIAMERAAAFLADKERFALARKQGQDEDSEPDAPEDRLRSFGDRERRAMSSSVSGSIYRVEMDPTHPLGYGYDDTYFTMKRGAAAFRFLERGWNVGVIRDDGPVAGFAGFEARQSLRNTLVVGQQPMGRGQVVYLIDSPLFRGFWHGGKLLFSNAVFMAGGGN